MNHFVSGFLLHLTFTTQTPDPWHSSTSWGNSTVKSNRSKSSSRRTRCAQVDGWVVFARLEMIVNPQFRTNRVNQIDIFVDIIQILYFLKRLDLITCSNFKIPIPQSTCDACAGKALRSCPSFRLGVFHKPVLDVDDVEEKRNDGGQTLPTKLPHLQKTQGANNCC